ncbi:MAG: anti-sigma factor [Terriglobia bacterium]
MNCPENRKLLNAYLDGELDLAHSIEVESHLAGCGTCAPAWESLRILQKGLRHNSLYFPAPPYLTHKLQKAFAKASAKPAPPRVWFGSWRWAVAAAAVAAVLITSLGVRQQLSRRSAQEAQLHEIVSAHIRSLMANHLTDVVSSDQHAVKPWFAGKLDFSPPVPDLAQEGFPLVGGRLDYLFDRNVAALVYQRRKHLINLFIWPADSDRLIPLKPAVSSGYNSQAWSNGEMMFRAVSDLNAAELAEFARLFSARTNSSSRK